MRRFSGLSFISFTRPSSFFASILFTCALGAALTACGGGDGPSTVSQASVVNTQSVGGTVNGLIGTVVLRINGTFDLSLNSNGAYAFSTQVAEGSSYSVAVLTQPSNQACTITNAAGVIGTSGVTNVAVDCATNATTLSVVANATVPVGGGSASVAVTNTGTSPAFNVTATLPGAWTAVGQDATACAALPPAATCNLTFTSTKPYVTQGSIAVKGSNTTAVNTALAFSFGAYPVYAIDSPTSARVIETATSSGSTYAPVQASTGCNSLTDGRSNTNCLLAAYPAATTQASLCDSNTAGGASAGTWYLPAICEVTNSSVAACTAGTSNVDTNLRDLGFAVADNIYASSTEASTANSFIYHYQSTPTDVLQYTKNATNVLVICAKTVAY